MVLLGSRAWWEEGIHWFHCFQSTEELRVKESNRETTCSHQPFYHTGSMRGQPQKCFPVSSSLAFFFFFFIGSTSEKPQLVLKGMYSMTELPKRRGITFSTFLRHCFWSGNSSFSWNIKRKSWQGHETVRSLAGIKQASLVVLVLLCSLQVYFPWTQQKYCTNLTAGKVIWEPLGKDVIFIPLFVYLCHCSYLWKKSCGFTTFE